MLSRSEASPGCRAEPRSCHAALRLSISWLLPLGAQVEPLRVRRLDQGHFLRPRPALDLLLSGDGSQYVRRGFEVDKERQVVLPGETAAELLLMLVDAPLQVVCYAQVDGSRDVRHDVDVVLVEGGHPLKPVTLRERSCDASLRLSMTWHTFLQYAVHHRRTSDRSGRSSPRSGRAHRD